MELQWIHNIYVFLCFSHLIKTINSEKSPLFPQIVWTSHADLSSPHPFVNLLINSHDSHSSFKINPCDKADLVLHGSHSSSPSETAVRDRKGGKRGGELRNEGRGEIITEVGAVSIDRQPCYIFKYSNEVVNILHGGLTKKDQCEVCAPWRGLRSSHRVPRSGVGTERPPELRRGGGWVYGWGGTCSPRLD